MFIGETIKKLRQERDMTQEQLAEFLNLTSSAISGWECGRTAPDISQIPLLSSIFGVSADRLLGIDVASNDRRIEEIGLEAERCVGEEKVRRYRAGLAEFPASYDLMRRLADSLDYPGNPKTLDARVKEQISLYEKILEGSGNPSIKNCAAGRLCGIYLSIGQRDKAVKIAESVPYLYYTREDLNRMLAEGPNRIHELHYRINDEFTDLCDDLLSIAAQNPQDKAFFTAAETITILEKIPKLHEIYYEKGDFLEGSSTVSIAYFKMAENYAVLCDRENTLLCLRKALKYAREADWYESGMRGSYTIHGEDGDPALPMEKRHTSLLSSPKLAYSSTTWWFGGNDTETLADEIRKKVTQSRFDFLRGEIDELLGEAEEGIDAGL